MRILQFLVISIILFGCSDPDEQENKSTSSGIGKSINDIVVAYNASDAYGNNAGSVKIEPYTAGIIMTMTPNSSFFYCSLGDDFIIQKGQQLKIQWSTKVDYDSYGTLYNGWVESGGSDGCSTIYTKQTIHFTSAKVGYSPSSDFDVAFSDLYYGGSKLRIPVRF